MAGVFGALKQLYIHSIPTIIFVIILFIILDRLFFRPMAEVMKKRKDATVGAIEAARKHAAAAEEKSRQYDAGMRGARTEMYSTLQEDRQKALAERESSLKSAREQADGLIHEAQASIAAEAGAAREQLLASSESLAREITERILSA